MTVPFLLIPGLNCTARVFAGLTDVLWPFGAVTVANHRGGDSIGAIAADILSAAPSRFALGGFSMGGYIAFEIMRQAPHRVDRLLLLDTSARPDTPEAAENRRRRIALAESGKFELVVEQSFPMAVHPDNQERADVRALHREMALANGADAYIRQQRAILARPDTRPDLASIAVPTMVIVGEGDLITPPAAAEEMHRAISGSRLAVIAGAGHMAIAEDPRSVYAAVRQWAEWPRT